jgi:hypothetical protein
MYATIILATSMTPAKISAQGICNGDIITPEKITLKDLNLDVKLEIDYPKDQPVKFKVSFLDSATGGIQPHIDYNFVITDASDKDIFNAAAAIQQSTLHTAEGVVTIPSPTTVDGYGKAIVTVFGINFIPHEPHTASFPCVPLQHSSVLLCGIEAFPPNLLSPRSLVIDEIPKAGLQWVITTSIQNQCDVADDIPIVVLIEVRNSDGVTERLGWQIDRLSAERPTTQAGISWIPSHADTYELRTFVISDFENPMILSKIALSNITIAD